MLGEIQVRRDAGQHQFAIHWLNNFPHEGVAGEILQKVKQSLESYQNEFTRGKLVVTKIKELLALIADTKMREKVRPICEEIEAELNLNTLDRMTAFEQSIDDETMDAEEKLSLALSGWLMGSNQSIRKLPVAASLFTVRNKVREYLEEPIKPTRADPGEPRVRGRGHGRVRDAPGRDHASHAQTLTPIRRRQVFTRSRSTASMTSRRSRTSCNCPPNMIPTACTRRSSRCTAADRRRRSKWTGGPGPWGPTADGWDRPAATDIS